jgi:hypothetical protein
MQRIRSIAWFTSGLIVSVIAIFLIGFLSIQIAGLRGGAVFGIDNQLVAATTPGPGLPQRLAIAAIAGACVALLALAARHRNQNERALIRWGFIAATAVQVAVSAVLSVQGAGAAGTLNDPQRPWAEGWVVQGGMNSAVHLLLIVAVFLLFAKPLRTSDASGTDSELLSEDDLQIDGARQD